MKISDILHKRSEPPRTPEDKKPGDAASDPSGFTNLLKNHLDAGEGPASPVPGHARLSAVEIYGGLVAQARSILSHFSKTPPSLPDMDEICEIVQRAEESLAEEPSRLLEYAQRSTPDDYVPGHLANICVLAIAVGRELRWDRETLRAAGVGALIHDAGLFLHPGKSHLKESSTSAERRELRRIPPERLPLVESFLKDFTAASAQIIRNILFQFQEQVSGGGPLGLTGDRISREARAVGMCHAYESLSHPRPYRPALLAHQALKRILELSGDRFDGACVKALLETLTLFPPGSYVKLNTGETAKVVRLNKKSPLRPVVKIALSAAGEKPAEEKYADLGRAPSLQIERAVDECALETADRKWLLEASAQKWWLL